MYALFKSDVSWDTFVVENLKACLALAGQFDDEKVTIHSRLSAESKPSIFSALA
jgi:hypothetical protein